MSKKSTVIAQANIDFTPMPEKQLTLVEVGDWNNANNRWSFYVPYSTRDTHGFIPTEVVKARMLRDFNVVVNHYSVCVKSF